jgi:hypothetical protein
MAVAGMVKVARHSRGIVHACLFADLPDFGREPETNDGIEQVRQRCSGAGLKLTAVMA